MVNAIFNDPDEDLYVKFYLPRDEGGKTFYKINTDTRDLMCNQCGGDSNNIYGYNRYVYILENGEYQKINTTNICGDDTTKYGEKVGPPKGTTSVRMCSVTPGSNRVEQPFPIWLIIVIIILLIIGGTILLSMKK